MFGEMDKATRLTRAGKLGEATALIQRSLRNTPLGQVIPAGESRARDSGKPLRLLIEPISDNEGQSASRPTPTKVRACRTPVHRPNVPSPLLSPDFAGFEGLPGRKSRLRRPPPADLAGPGQWISASHAGAVGSRNYKLYIPSRYADEPLPLVVMLHGCTQDPDDFAAGTAMNTVAEAEGFLVAYPEQTAASNPSRCWNWFQAAHQQREGGEPSIIAGIARQIMTQYNVDPSRVYVAGLSAGGAMAAIVAATHSDLFAALGVHSGLAPGSAHDLPSALQAMRQGGSANRMRIERPVPLIIFHGDRDLTVQSRNAVQFVEQWMAAAASAPGKPLPPAAVLQGQVPSGRAFTRKSYIDWQGEPIVEWWTIHGAGHAWAGGSADGSYTDPAGPDASREFARFFREHPRVNTRPSSQ